MLERLYIENIAVIEKAEIEFTPGLCVLTGETGAGKSILINAVGALMGERFYKDMIRAGTSRAVVSAVFTQLGAHTLERLAAHGVAPDEEGALVLAREVSADARSVARVGGVPVPVATLRAVAGELVSIHGQQDNGALLDDSRHVDMIDAFVRDPSLFRAYREQYDRYTLLARELAALDMSESDKQRKLELLDFQIHELETAQMQEGEDDELTARRKLIQNAERIASDIAGAYALLHGDDDSAGILELLGTLDERLTAVARYVPDLEDKLPRMADAVDILEEYKDDLRNLQDSIEFDPHELDRIEQRLDALYRLKQKYNKSLAELIAYEQSMRDEREGITLMSERAEVLARELEAARAQLDDVAEVLTQARREAAAFVCERIANELEALNMPSAVIETQHDITDFTPNGRDAIAFLLAANPGEPPRPLSRIASGGELSRIMLAFKSVVSGESDIETLIFDEIDAGISGRAAQKVAEKLGAVAADRQVLCVTHLAQIAALASNHYRIEKQVADGRTYTQVTRLDRDGRLDELSRIIGGSEVNDLTRAAAEQMLQA